MENPPATDGLSIGNGPLTSRLVEQRIISYNFHGTATCGTLMLLTRQVASFSPEEWVAPAVIPSAGYVDSSLNMVGHELMRLLGRKASCLSG